MPKTDGILPLLVVLDNSPSTRWVIRGNKSPMDYANEQINKLIDIICEDPETARCVELSIVTFANEPMIVPGCEFKPVEEYKRFPPKFHSVDYQGTQTAKAVDFSINYIYDYVQQLKNFRRKCYRPHIVLITDGDPDRNEDPNNREKTIARINALASTDDVKKAIRPIVVGVGDNFSNESIALMKRYAYGLKGEENLILVNGESDTDFENKYRDLIQFISTSVKVSVNVQMANLASQTETYLRRNSLNNDGKEVKKSRGLYISGKVGE